MSDQGWGEPQFNQPPFNQPLGGRPAMPPQQPGQAPQYGPPPQQPGQAPQYGPPQYGSPQPQYGQPQYGQSQPAYGQPSYGPPAYGHPPQGYGQSPYGSSTGGGSKKGLLFGGLGAVVVAAIVVLVLFATGVFGGSSDGSGSSPSAAVSHFFSALKSGDTDTARSLQCSADRSNPDLKLTDAHISSYTVGKTKQSDSTHSTVATTVRASTSSKAETVQLPVVKQDGGWRVCFSQLAGLGGGTEHHATQAPSPAGS